MLLDGLMGKDEGVSSGIVSQKLLNGQYRVLYKGRPALAMTQSGPLVVGQAVTVAQTSAGLAIVSAGDTTATTLVEVEVNG